MTHEEIFTAINSTPAIVDLLYDLNLMPEQTIGKESFAYTAYVVEHVMAAISAEREACRKICADEAAKVYDHAKGPYLKCADAIAARAKG